MSMAARPLPPPPFPIYPKPLSRLLSPIAALPQQGLESPARFVLEHCVFIVLT